MIVKLMKLTMDSEKEHGEHFNSQGVNPTRHIPESECSIIK